MSTDPELIERAAEIFDHPDKWSTFLEIRRHSDHIVRHWLERATRLLRAEVAKDLPDLWICNGWDPDPACFGASVATGWQLKEFGEQSLILGFQWGYEFHLYNCGEPRFSSAQMAALLLTPGFSRVADCFGGGQRGTYKGPNDLCFEGRKFYFQNAADGSIPLDELAWYAGVRSDEFIRQAAAKVKAITHDPEMTGRIRELHLQSRLPVPSESPP